MTEADTFTLLNDQGAILEQNGATASNACLEENFRMTPSLTPGTHAQGSLYLEAPAGAVTLMWNLGGVDGSGWTWSLK